MSGEDHPHASLAGGVDHAHNPSDERVGIGHVADDPDLHVVDQQGHPLGVADLLEGLGDLQSIGALHRSS
jgi:hypothetical protein